MPCTHKENAEEFIIITTPTNQVILNTIIARCFLKGQSPVKTDLSKIIPVELKKLLMSNTWTVLIKQFSVVDLDCSASSNTVYP